MSTPTPGEPALAVPHMTPDEFRRRAKEAVDFIADYWEQLAAGKGAGELPVLCPLKPGDTAAKLPVHAPDRGERWEAILADLNRTIVPGLTHWQSPHFFAFFPANGSFPAIIGDLLSTGLGVQGMLWATSPACTEVETRVLDWLAEMLELPSSFLSTSEAGGGVIHGTASESVLTALVAARDRARRAGRIAHPTIYTSTQAHSSVIKAAMIAGLAAHPEDRTHLRLIGVDDTLAMRPDLLERAMADDSAAGRTPTFVCATIGTTSSTAVDSLDRLGPICRQHNAWLHVDAAFAGSALTCPEHRWMSRGLDLADSFSFNPHKWLLTSFDCSCFWTSERKALIDSLSVTPEYLRNAASSSGEVIDYRDWQIPLGRRFRALKLWLVIRHYGVEGLRAYIREHIRLARLFEQLVQSDPRFGLAAPRTTSLVCFRLRPLPDEEPANTDARNKRLLDALNASGKLYLTHTVLPTVGPAPDCAPGPPRYVLRMAIGATQTREEHVQAAWDLIETEARAQARA